MGWGVNPKCWDISIFQPVAGASIGNGLSALMFSVKNEMDIHTHWINIGTNDAYVRLDDIVDIHIQKRNIMEICIQRRNIY